MAYDNLMERKNHDGHPPDEEISRRAFLRRMVGLSDQEGGPSLLNTVGLSTVVALGLVATAPLAVKVEESSSLKIGSSEQNRRDLKRLREDPIQFYLATSLLAPIIEEIPLRILPSLLLPGSMGTMWKVGIPLSGIFAEIHALERDEETRQVGLDPNTIPIYQFGLGLFFWKLVRERGYLHALVAHSIFNTVQTTIFLSGILEHMNESHNRVK